MRPLHIFSIAFAVIIAVAFGIYLFNQPEEVVPPPSCTPSWDCSNWSSCIGGNESRTCADKNSCSTDISKPETSRTCAVTSCGNSTCELGETCSSCAKDCGACKPTCTEKWKCSAWSSCQGGSQSRTCTDQNVCGSAANRPSQFQSCTVTCTENWSCGNWSTCSQGNQSRTCTDLNTCGTTVNKPTPSQSCSLGCTENWSCAAWDVCSNGTQVRTCSDVNACGTTTSKPPISQSCSATCTENWTCAAWGTCSNNSQSRTCTDGNSCGTTTGKPNESQSCTSLPTVTVTPFDTSASEDELDPAQFLVKRTGSKTNSLTVKLGITGTATEGSDYDAIGGSVVIPSGLLFVRVNVIPIDDAIVEGDETVNVAILPDAAAYVVGAQNAVSINLLDYQLTFSLGIEQKIWDYGDSSCGSPGPGIVPDLPDGAYRAVKTASGELMVTRGNGTVYYTLRGTNFNNLQTNCADGPAIVAGNNNNPNSEPQTFFHQQWIGALYRDLTSGNSARIHALIHNEYHDPRDISGTPCRIGVVDPFNRCVQYTVTSAYSDNDGKTFSQDTANAQHVVAVSPIKWSPFLDTVTPPPDNFPIYGFHQPTNIVKHTDGYFYTLFAAINDPNPHYSTRGTCLIRTKNLGDPSSWRAWDGSGFGIHLNSPYGSNPNTTHCAFIGIDTIVQLTGSLTFNTYLGKYLLVGTSVAARVPDPDIANPSDWICGTYYSLSDDLINWKRKKLILEHKITTPPCTPFGQSLVGSIIYPSIIDHSQFNDPTDPNFEKSNSQPNLYYSRHNGGLDRDLWRRPITICEMGKPAPGCP